MAITRTVQQVIEIAKEHEDFDPVRALQLFNEAHVYILGDVRLIPDTTTTISYVAGQMEYSLPNNVARIWDCIHYDAQASYTPLLQTDESRLYYEDYGPGWEAVTASKPSKFYERGGNIGFWPPPAFTTNGSYPCATLYYTQINNLGLSDSLPGTISSIYPWVYFMCAKQAATSDKPGWQANVQSYEQLFEKEMNKLRRWIHGRTPRDKQRIVARVPRIRRA
jgi:hypothetical protein